LSKSITFPGIFVKKIGGGRGGGISVIFIRMKKILDIPEN